MDQSFVFHWVLLPLLIFCSRILDVTLGTLRIILLSKGNRLYAPILGFFEVLLWLIVMVNVVKTLDHPIFYIAYAGGFAMGNFVGMTLESKIALGLSLLRIVTARDAEELTDHLRLSGYTITDVPAQGNRGPVHVLFTVVRRKEIQNLIAVIRQYNPKAFYTIEDVSYVSTSYGLATSRRRRHLRFPSLTKRK